MGRWTLLGQAGLNEIGVMLVPQNKAMKLTSALAEPAVCWALLHGLGQGHRARASVGARARRSQLIASVLRTLRGEEGVRERRV